MGRGYLGKITIHFHYNESLDLDLDLVFAIRNSQVCLLGTPFFKYSGHLRDNSPPGLLCETQ
jgi:hypothetical protein